MGKSACVHGLSYMHVSVQRQICSCESFNMKQGQQTMLSFLSTAKKSQDKQVTIIFGIRVNKIILRVASVLKVTIK